MRNHVITLLLILFFANTGFAQQTIVSREKPLNFSRKDCINLSIYDWPRTLLSYPVYFPEGIQSESEELVLFFAADRHAEVYIHIAACALAIPFDLDLLA